MSLVIESIQEDQNKKRVSITGSLDSDTAPDLQQHIEAEISDEVTTTIIDFKTLDFLSSAGLRVIFQTKKLMEGRDGKLLLVNLQPQIKKVFEIIKALDGMDVFKDQAEMDEYLTAMQNQITDA